MELTLKEALQMAVEAHKAGQIQEADHLYTAILQAQPKHPDANHNMGVLAVSVGKVKESLPFFKTALEANPKIGQYWLSCIDALIKLERITDAKAVLAQAKGNGANGDGFGKLEHMLNLLTEVPADPVADKNALVQGQPNILDTLKLDQALKLAKKESKKGFSKEAKNIYQAILTKFPKNKKAVDGFKALSGGRIGKLSKAQEPPKNQLQSIYHLYNQGQLQQVLIEASKLLQQFPNSAILHNICGVANRGLGQPDAAIKNYKKALTIKPDYALAHNNMGIILKEQHKLEEAIKAFNKALAIKPDNTITYNNLGNVLQEQGKVEEAIEAFNKALAIKPDFTEVWNNIIFPLQVIKMTISSKKELVNHYPEHIKSKYDHIAKSLLHYRLNRGGKCELSSLDEALSLLSSAENRTIPNPTFNKNSHQSTSFLPNKIVALVNFGRSGTGLLHSLVDGHPSMSTLPSIYFSEYFDQSIWEKIIIGGWSEMVDRFISVYEVLFDASSDVAIESKSKQLIYNIGQIEGMANLGDQKNEVLSVDKTIFRSELNRLIDCEDELDAFIFFKLVHAAYNKAINDINEKSLVFYHIHNPDTYAQLNFVRSASNSAWMMMVREPIQSCESWIRNKFFENRYSDVVNRIYLMLFDVNNIIYQKQDSIGFRLEDLKENPRKTIPALCKWMDIEETESLYEMTAQGKRWWGDPTSPDFEKDGMDPFGQTSIKRKVGSIFNEYDQFILRTLFYPFSMQFGYCEANFEQFKIDLQKIRPMLDQMFDFEKTIIKRTEVDAEQLMKSGSYLYLRSGLIERWNTLNKFGTYPNMIRPLVIT